MDLLWNNFFKGFLTNLSQLEQSLAKSGKHENVNQI